MNTVDNLYLLEDTDTGRLVFEYSNWKGHRKKAIFKSEKDLYKSFRKTTPFDKIYKKKRRHYGKPCSEFHEDLREMKLQMLKFCN
jgi:hypothetical protein